jgi:AcrR family transcriptional regulator
MPTTPATAAGPLPAGRVQPATAQGRGTRHALIAAALAEFGELGYVDARVEQITARAGVGYGTFYKYFHSKRDLVRAVMCDVYDDIFNNAMAETHSARPVAERAYLDILAAIRSFYRHREALRVLDRAIGLDPELAEYLAGLQRRDVDFYQETITTTPGYVPAGDPHIVSLAVNALVDEVARRWIRSEEVTGDLSQDEPRMEAIARLLAAMCLPVIAGSTGEAESQHDPSR